MLQHVTIEPVKLLQLEQQIYSFDKKHFDQIEHGLYTYTHREGENIYILFIWMNYENLRLLDFEKSFQLMLI